MEEQELKTAIHEAGHEIAFHRLFPKHDSIGLTVEPDDDSSGAHFSEQLTVKIAANCRIWSNVVFVSVVSVS